MTYTQNGFIFDDDGRVLTVSMAGGEALPTGAYQQNGFTFDEDGKLIVLSDSARSGSGGVYVQEDAPEQGATAWVWYKPSTEATTWYPGDDAAVPAAPSFTVDPLITGTGAVGDTLTCDGGTVTGSPTPTNPHQWQNAGVAIGGETASTYVVQAGDVGDLLRCHHVATNTEGTDTANSNTITGSEAVVDEDLPGIFDTILVEGWEARAVTASDDDVLTAVAGVNGGITLAGTVTYKTAVDGSEPGLRFNGTTQGLTASLPDSIPQPWEVLVVAKVTDATNAGAQVLFSARNTSLGLQVDSGASPQPVRLFGPAGALVGGLVPTAAWNTDYRMWRAHVDGASSYIQHDGTLDEAVGDLGATALEFNIAFGTTAFGGNYKYTLIAAVLLSDTPTSDQITAFRARYSV